MLLGYKITLAFMRILSLLCVCFLSSFVSNVSAQVVEKVFDILGRDSLSVQRTLRFRILILFVWWIFKQNWRLQN